MYKHLFTLFLFLTTTYTFGQKSKIDDPIASRSSFYRMYQDSMQSSSLLYKGKEYKYYDVGIEGHPFFHDDGAAIGNIYYDGFLYKDVSMYFDLVYQQLVVEHGQLAYSIILEPLRLDSFELYGHRFLKLQPDSLQDLREGFYDEMAVGNVSFYVRREKKYEERIDDRDFEKWFESITKYYLLKDSVYYKVKSKGSILKVLEDEKKALKALIKQEQLTFARSPESSIKRLVEYYNHLKQ